MTGQMIRRVSETAALLKATRITTRAATDKYREIFMDTPM
jgi:hypothetical protein